MYHGYNCSERSVKYGTYRTQEDAKFVTNHQSSIYCREIARNMKKREIMIKTSGCALICLILHPENMDGVLRIL